MFEVTIRPAHPDDLGPLTELYNHYVRETPITFDIEPYTAARRRPWFDQFAEHGRYRLLSAETEGRVVGYAATMPFRAKAAYQTSVEASVYLAPGALGRGIGSLLYEELFKAIGGQDVHRAYAGITLPNPGSVALHEKFGFQSIGVYHEVGRKFGRYWDVEWFERELV
jgi:phosphinothricin acetyltransferase